MILLDYAFLFLPLVGRSCGITRLVYQGQVVCNPVIVAPDPFGDVQLLVHLPLVIRTDGVVPSLLLPDRFPFRSSRSRPDREASFEEDAARGDEVRRERRFWGVGVAMALLLAGGYLLQVALRSSPSAWASEVRSLSATIKPSSILYADTLSIRGLEFMQGYPSAKKWIDFADLTSPAEIQPGSLILVNTAYIEWLNRNGGMWLIQGPGTGSTRSTRSRLLPGRRSGATGMHGCTASSEGAVQGRAG